MLITTAHPTIKKMLEKVRRIKKRGLTATMLPPNGQTLQGVRAEMHQIPAKYKPSSMKRKATVPTWDYLTC